MKKLVASFANLGARIGILGGTFDPVHFGHIELAKLAILQLNLNSVVFIPTNQNPLKSNAPQASNQARLSMLSLALDNEDKLYFSDLECRQNSGISYSVDSLNAIQADIGSFNSELFFLIGADQIEKLHLWKNYQELFSLAKLVVFGRNGVNAQSFRKINPNLSSAEIENLSKEYIEFDFRISSTALRKSITNGEFENIRSSLPERVFDFILQSKVYK